MSGRPLLPREPRVGEPLAAAWGAQIVRYLRSLTPQTSPTVGVNHTANGVTLRAAKAGTSARAGKVLVMEFDAAGAVPTGAEIIAALQKLYDPDESPLDPVPSPAAGDIVNLFTNEGEGGETKVLRYRAIISTEAEDPHGTEDVAVDFDLGSGAAAQTWHAMLFAAAVPWVWDVEYTQDEVSGPPTVGDLRAALEEFYVGDRLPENGDIVTFSRDGRARYRAWITPREPGITEALTSFDFAAGGKTWFALTVDISGEVHLSDATGTIDIDLAGGIKIKAAEITDPDTDEPAGVELPAPDDSTHALAVRQVQVIDGAEIKTARVLASAPQSEDPPRHLTSLVAGAGCEFQPNIEEGGPDVVVVPFPAELRGYLALESVASGGTDPAGNPLATLRLHNTLEAPEDSLVTIVTDISGDVPVAELRLRLVDNPASAVRIVSGDGGETYYCDLQAWIDDVLEPNQLVQDDNIQDLFDLHNDVVVPALDGLGGAIDTTNAALAALEMRVAALEAQLAGVDFEAFLTVAEFDTYIADVLEPNQAVQDDNILAIFDALGAASATATCEGSDIVINFTIPLTTPP